MIAGGPERWADKAAGVAGEHASLADVAATFTRVFGKQVWATSARLWLEEGRGGGWWHGRGALK